MRDVVANRDVATIIEMRGSKKKRHVVANRYVAARRKMWYDRTRHVLANRDVTDIREIWWL